MPAILSALFAGLLFGAGLALAGMTDPSVVLGFLDIAGRWNPALLFVMAGAVIVTFVGYRLALARPRPLLAQRFLLPSVTQIDAPLIVGAALFGLGWGLAGYCPGPAVASLVSGNVDVLMFVAAMVIGMLLAPELHNWRRGLRELVETVDETI
jgi:uncharacterized protein